MIRIEQLAETPLVRLARFDHPCEQPHEDPEEESADAFSINFVLRGQYELRIEGERWRMAPHRVFVTRPGLCYSCRHAEERPTDVCLGISFLDTGDERSEADPGSPRRLRHDTSVVALDDRLAYLRWRLENLGRREIAPLEVEEVASELLSAVTARGTDASAPRYRETQLRWYAERIEAARSLIADRCESDHSLASLARQVGMSPYHFARIFRLLCGSSPHQTLLVARLERARSMLRQGASVTETCFACGFNSVSYFSRLFARRVGVRPSRFAAAEFGKKVPAQDRRPAAY